MRYAVAGWKSHTSAPVTGAAICRSGVTLSRTQNERPNVAMTKSFSCTTRSRTEVSGKLSSSDCQSSPSSNETYTPLSVHAYSNPLRELSSRTQFKKLPSGIPYGSFLNCVREDSSQKGLL